MTKKLVDNSIGRLSVEFSNPLIDEARKTFKNNSYEEIQKAYGLSEKEIDGYIAKYIKDTQNINFAVSIAILLLPAVNFELSLGSIGELISKKLAEKGLEISAEQVVVVLSKVFFAEGLKVTDIAEEEIIRRSDLIKLSPAELKKIQNQEINEINKERMYIAVAGREKERYQEAAKLADKDEEFLRPVVTKNLSMVSPEDIRNMCKGNNICIDEERFKKKYLGGDVRIARERLSRYLNFMDNYINVNQIARTNYYLEPFTKKARPFSNSRQSNNNMYRR